MSVIKKDQNLSDLVTSLWTFQLGDRRQECHYEWKGIDVLTLTLTTSGVGCVDRMGLASKRSGEGLRTSSK